MERTLPFLENVYKVGKLGEAGFKPRLEERGCILSVSTYTYLGHLAGYVHASLSLLSTYLGM